MVTPGTHMGQRDSCRAFIRKSNARRWPWRVVLALVVPLAGCSTECERAAEKVCKAAQAAAFDTCIKRATAKACKAVEAAADDACIGQQGGH